MCRPYYCRQRRHYGFTNFLGDAIMFCLTGGLWLIWIIIREIRIRDGW